MIYMKIGHRDSMANEHITVGRISYEKIKTFVNLGSLLTNQNCVQKEREL